MMATADDGDAADPKAPTGSGLVGRGLLLTFAVLGWGTACWLTYAIVPATSRLLDDFGREVDPFSLFVLRTAWLLTPLVAAASLGVFLLMPDRWQGRCSLLLPPIAIATIEGGVHLAALFALNAALQ